MVKISIIIPAFNVEKYIKKAIESCLNQTLKAIEVIVINDGSTDATGEICKGYELEYTNVKYYETVNQGLSMARNEGLKYVQGEYVCFLDADDWLESQALQKCYEELVNNKLDYIFFDSIQEDEDGIYIDISKHSMESDRIYSGEELAEIYCKKGNIHHEAWRCICSYDFLKAFEIKFIPGIYYEDMPYQMKLLLSAKRIKYLSEGLYHYTIRNGSIMRSSMNMKKIESIFHIAEYMLNSIRDNKSFIWKVYVSKQLKGLFEFNLFQVSHSCVCELSKYKEEILLYKRNLIDIVMDIFTDINEGETYRVLANLLEPLILSLDINDGQMIEKLEEVFRVNQNNVREKLSLLPFSDGCKKIGIYGSGFSADSILELYCKLVGPINSQIIYIDSKKKSGESKHLGFDVYNVNDLNSTEITDIVILSFMYEEEIYNTIKKIYGKRYVIHKFYGSDVIPVERVCFGKVFEKYKAFKNELLRKRIILIYTPEYSNIGDHLITVAERQFFQSSLPEYAVIEISKEEIRDNEALFGFLITKKDVLVVTGGGFLGSLWTRVPTKVINEYPDNKIIIMPQSIYYEDSEYGRMCAKEDAEVFSKHKDLTVCFREKISINRFMDLKCKNVNVVLVPDMALYLDFAECDMERNRIMLCLRNDKEKNIDDASIEKIKKIIGVGKDEIVKTDMLDAGSIPAVFRNEVVDRKIQEFKRSKLVITDRLHGMIFSVITRTPCIAINNLTHKIKGVYQWIEELDYVKFLPDIEELKVSDINKIINSKAERACFYGEEYKKLERLLDEHE